MEYKYKKDNIPSAIARAIFENEKQNKKDRMYYVEIHNRVEQLLHHPLSDRQLVKNLSNMVDEKLLNRDDPTGKRGAKVYFSLTEKAKRKYRLMILGIDKNVEKRESLYKLLIFFEVYKRRPLLTEKQLARFLKQIGSSINGLKRVKEIKLFDNITETVFKPIKGVEIIGFPQYDSKTKSNKMLYYTVIPGFSVEEFMIYLRLLKMGTEPRPFTTSRTIVPFALYKSYTKKEIEEAFELFNIDGLIQAIDPVIPGEERYNIADEALRHLAYAIWSASRLDYELLLRRLVYNIPSDKDKKYLELYLGERLANIMIAEAYRIRRSFKKEKQGKIKEEEQEQAIRKMQEYRRFLVQEIIQKFENVIQENEVVREIVEGVCFSPFISQNSSQT